MRPKSTTEQGRDHESAMVDLLQFDHARRSPSSGSQWNDNTDVVGDSFAMECESTSAASYSFKADFWREALGKSRADRIPLVGIQFRDVNPKKNLNLIVLSSDDFAEIYEIYRMYQKDEL